jgi:hypothetical protein
MEVFGQLLDQFDTVVKLGTDGRANHTGATKQLQALALEAGKIVRAMDARNRMRFRNDQQALGAWINASRIVARPASLSPEEVPGPEGEQGETPGAGGDVRPAA